MQKKIALPVWFVFLGLVVIWSLGVSGIFHQAFAHQQRRMDSFEARPSFHIRPHAVTSSPSGLSPQQIKDVYQLPVSSGSGTIAIVDAYDDQRILADINHFSSAFGLQTLSTCTSPTQQSCFEKHKMGRSVRRNNGWALEESLDTEWAHAVAPKAHILLVESRTGRAGDLLSAIDYARNRSDVVAISISWGGSEFSGEGAYDTHFMSPFGAGFFAAAGDNGAGVEWPAVSPNVTSVGGTSLAFINNKFDSETAWDGSGGGLSLYETEPGYQSSYGIPQANNHRAVPDVAFDADPVSGVSVYDSVSYGGE